MPNDPTTWTEQKLRGLLGVIDAGLTVGLGSPAPGEMCVEAAVQFASGAAHDDRPPCVASFVREVMIVLNDSLWTSPGARAKGMRRAAIAQLGSAGVIDELMFGRRLAELTTRRFVPLALRTAADGIGDVHSAKLLEAAERCARDGDHASAARAARAAGAAERAWAVGEVGEVGAARAAEAEWGESGDRVLSAFAEMIVEILQELGSPGCEWLWLTEPSGEEN